MLLVDTYRRLSGGCRPAADPINILLRDVRRIARNGHDALDIAVSEDSLWARLLRDPSLASAAVQLDASDAAATMQNRFQGVRDLLRSELTKRNYTKFVDDRGKPMGRLRFLQTLAQRQTLAADAVEIIISITETKLARPSLKTAVQALTGHEHKVLNSTGDLWLYFWAAEAVSLLNQGIRMKGYGKRNPGNADVEQAAYLAFVDAFITNDRRFKYGILRPVERVGANRKLIWSSDVLLQQSPGKLARVTRSASVFCAGSLGAARC
jgi:hypothetical protein